jgi:hypothetical protein
MILEIDKVFSFDDLSEMQGIAGEKHAAGTTGELAQVA